MKTNRFRLLIATLAAWMVLASGCVTENQVKQIVDNANYQALVASTPGLEPGGIPPNGKVEESAETAAARINAFLESHQNDPVMTGALRLRQALLYLNQRAFDLAQASVTQIPADSLRSPRDQAIFTAFPALLWWSQYALMTNQEEFYASHKDEAIQHMASLKEQADGLGNLPDVQGYLIEMRAWIALKLALSTRDAAFATSTIEDAVDAWAATFSPAELTVPAGAKPLDFQTRRIIRLRAFLNEVATQTAGLEIANLIFKANAVNEYYASLPH